MDNRPIPPILERIVRTKVAEVAALRGRQSRRDLEAAARRRLEGDVPRGFAEALRRPGPVPNVIAELKKASPSKGVIREDFSIPPLARAYEEGGAAALSCLTDETYFRGRLEYLREARAASTRPVLRKDFLIHPEQVLEACAAGADAVLLIARILARTTLRELYALATDLGLDVLLEVHDEPDLEAALAADPAVIGVNNRDLDTFTVDVETTLRLRESIPEEILVVAESGIREHAQLLELKRAGVGAVLVGESLMREADVSAALRRLLTGA
jgi:indole-3-glycerol phosphate synthase